MNVTQADIVWADLKCELTEIKAILLGDVVSKAVQYDIEAIVKYPLEVIILPFTLQV